MSGTANKGGEHSGPPDPASATGRPEKKRFEPPQLIEWGSIAELTRGQKQGKEDFPFGGTRGL